MRTIPCVARIYLLAVYAVGLGLAYETAARLASPSAPVVGSPIAAAPWEFVAFMLLAVLAGSRKVQLIRGSGYDEAGSMSLGFAITFAALLRFGLTGGVIVGAVSTASACLHPVRQPAYQFSFNVALTVIAAWVCGTVLALVARSARIAAEPAWFGAVILASMAYFAVNTGGVAAAICLCSGESPVRLWFAKFMWTAPSYVAAASIATLATVVFEHERGAALLFGVPVAYLAYQAFAIYVDREEKQQRHIAELQQSKAQLADIYMDTVKSLALAIDAKDQYTHQHILRVQRYALAIGEKMGINETEMDGLRTGALLHDIGKLGVPEYVLLKPGRLTDDEYAKIKKHPEIGAAILDPVEFPWPVLPVVKSHHERWDGAGYPEGLRGEEIPRTARILAVADAYDAMTSTRAYRTALSHDRAVATIRAEAGRQFDPAVVEAFVVVIDAVVAEMALEGHGPLAAGTAVAQAGTSKADQAAREIQRASFELSTLYEVAQTLSSSLGVDETLDILARKLHAIVPGTGCLFLLREQDDGVLRMRAAVGVNREFFEGSRTLGENSASAQVADRRATRLGTYDADDLLLTASPAAAWTPLQSSLIVPIVHEDGVLGTINLYHPDRNAFGAHDQKLLETIADRVAAALYSGVLFDRARSHAFTDPLTGLYNPRYLAQYVDERCRQATLHAENLPDRGDSGQYALVGSTARLNCSRDARDSSTDRFGLVCIDLDSFKAINDNFGHQKGDLVLRGLARLFRSVVRDADVVARYGGDEFMIVLQGAGAAEARKMAERLLDAVARFDAGLAHPKHGPIPLGASAGYACFPADGDNGAALLSAVDARLYADRSERKLEHLASRSRDAAAVGTADSEGGAAVIYLKTV